MRLRFEVSYVAAVPELQKRNTGITSDLTSRSTEAELVEPLIFRGKLTYHENGLEHVLYKTATPIDDDTTLFCQFIARNDDPTPDRWEDISAMDRVVQAEDKALLEEIESDLPTDVTSEVHIKADRMTLEYRRILGELAQLPAGGGLPPDGPGAAPTSDDAAGTAASAGATYALVQRPDGDGSRIARVNLRTGEFDVLGHVRPIPSRCALHGRRLSCLAGGDAVHLWKL